MLVLLVVVLHASQHASGVEVTEGAELVSLPCSFHHPDLDESTVVWSRTDLNPSVVHLRQKEGDDVQSQNQQYRGRTSLSRDALSTGDLSLTLSAPSIVDSSTYTCTVRRFGEDLFQTEVLLQVHKARAPILLTVVLVVLALVLAVIGGVVFHFRTYLRTVPEVEVESGAESVLLPVICTVQLPVGARVEWTVRDKKVHVHGDSSDRHGGQHWFYKDRAETKMMQDMKIFRIIGLKLKFPTDRDNDTYVCSVYSRDADILSRKRVKLTVRVPETVVDPDLVSVQLPCKSTVYLSEDMTIEWSFNHIWVTKVFVYRRRCEQTEDLDELYRNRTAMENLLENEDLSLTLKYPTDRDNHSYTCTVYGRDGSILMQKQVKLTVRVRQVEVEEGAESVHLPFTTTADLSNIQVEWWRSEPEPPLMVLKCNRDQSEELDRFYRKRTKMNKESGDFGLTLMFPTDRDTGRYICTVHNKKNKRVKAVVLRVINYLVAVEEGAESVELPFITTPGLPADTRVVWTRIHPEPGQKVHVYPDQDQQDQQDPVYRQRTQMKTSPLESGELSLTLSRPSVAASGTYRCEACSNDEDICRETLVKLQVKEKPRDQNNDTVPLMADQSVRLVR